MSILIEKKEGSVQPPNVNVISSQSNEVMKESLARLSKPLFTISRFNKQSDNIPKQEKMAWDQFLDLFSKHPPRKTKDGPAWAPVSFRRGSTRKKENVEQIYMAVLDIDDGTPHEELLAKFSKFEYLAHSSFSHKPEHEKYRIILPFDNPVSPSNWDDVWRRLNYLAGGKNDSAVKDASRLYFTPGHPADTDFHFVKTNPGRFLSVRDLPEIEKTSIKAAINTQSIYGRKLNIEGLSEEPLSSEEGLQEVVSRCEFMKFASMPDNQPYISEPLWVAMISNACRFETGDEWIHEASREYLGYDEIETTRKIEHVRSGSSPITCQRIRELGFQGCPTSGCNCLNGQITKSPAGLAGWMYKKKGSHGHGLFSLQPDKKSSDLEFARAFVGQSHGGHLAYYDNQIVAYRDGHWPALDVNSEIKKPLLAMMGDVTASKVNKVYELLKIEYASKPEVFERKGSLTCLKNGTLNPLTSELLLHSPGHHITNKLEIEYQPEADCPLWLQTLDEIFQPDADKEDKIRLLQEYIGYCLIPDTRMCKFIWLIGKGGNGKSVVLDVVEMLIGRENITNAHIDRFDDKFVRAELRGKLVNISSEMSSEATVADGYLKQIVSGDSIEAERKHEPSFSFKPYARIFASTNKLPRLHDHSEGFSRRAIILTFNRYFSEGEQDKNRKAKLQAELSGILNWAVEGLQRLMNRGSFIMPISSQVAVAEYRMNSDPVRLFASEFLEPTESKDLYTQSAFIYSQFREWCLSNGFKVMASNSFSGRLIDLGYQKERISSGVRWRFTYNAELAKPQSGEASISTAASRYSV